MAKPEVFVRSGWLCLVMDFADGGDLCAAIKAADLRHLRRFLGVAVGGGSLEVESGVKSGVCHDRCAHDNHDNSS